MRQPKNTIKIGLEKSEDHKILILLSTIRETGLENFASENAELKDTKGAKNQLVMILRGKENVGSSPLQKHSKMLRNENNHLPG